jgi:hypothetical protein
MQLHCPTCEGLFLDRQLHQDPEPEQHIGVAPVQLKRGSPPYLVCEHGHKWSVRSITRDWRGDAIVLGELVGYDPPR